MPVSELVKLLVKSKRPLFHIGNGVRESADEFLKLIEYLQIPFVTARNGNDLCESRHPFYIGRPGTFAQRGANFAVQTCDLYIAIGTRLSLAQTGYNSLDYAREAKIIHVNIDQAELDKGTLRNPINICMDAGEFLKELSGFWEYLSGCEWGEWVKRCQSWRDRYPVVLPEYKEEKGYVNSYQFISVLSSCAASGDTIVTDMGFAFQNTHQAWEVKKGQRLITNCGLAPMGWGLPAAVGAAFATGRRVICITGEGGLMFNIQELATIMHHQPPTKIFVLNNGGYLTIKQTQEQGFEGRLMGSTEKDLSFPSMMAVGSTFNLFHICITDNEWLTRLPTFLDTDGPALCEIVMSPDQPQAPKALNRRNPDGTMNPTKLEDSFPFLPPEVIAEEMKL